MATEASIWTLHTRGLDSMFLVHRIQSRSMVLGRGHSWASTCGTHRMEVNTSCMRQYMPGPRSSPHSRLYNVACLDDYKRHTVCQVCSWSWPSRRCMTVQHWPHILVAFWALYEVLSKYIAQIKRFLPKCDERALYVNVIFTKAAPSDCL